MPFESNSAGDGELNVQELKQNKYRLIVPICACAAGCHKTKPFTTEKLNYPWIRKQLYQLYAYPVPRLSSGPIIA